MVVVGTLCVAALAHAALSRASVRCSSSTKARPSVETKSVADTLWGMFGYFVNQGLDTFYPKGWTLWPTQGHARQ